MVTKNISLKDSIFCKIWGICCILVIMNSCIHGEHQEYFYPVDNRDVAISNLSDKYLSLDDRNVESFISDWQDASNLTDTLNGLDSLFEILWKRNNRNHDCRNIALRESIQVRYHAGKFDKDNGNKYQTDLLKWRFPKDTLTVDYTPRFHSSDFNVIYYDDRMMSFLRAQSIVTQDTDELTVIRSPRGSYTFRMYPEIFDIHFFKNGILYGIFFLDSYYAYLFAPCDGSKDIEIGGATFDFFL